MDFFWALFASCHGGKLLGVMPGWVFALWKRMGAYVPILGVRCAIFQVSGLREVLKNATVIADRNVKPFAGVRNAALISENVLS